MPRNGEGNFQDGAAAWGKFSDNYDETGWSLLEVHTNPDIDDATTAASAGYFEGWASAMRIEQYANNMAVQTYNMTKSLEDYIDANSQFMTDSIELASTLESGSPDRMIWYHTDLLQKQMEGIYLGYLKGRDALGAKAVLATPLTQRQFLLLNLGGDLEDLGSYHSNTLKAQQAKTDPSVSPVLSEGRCSAIIRLTDDNQDIFIAQETWSSLNTMIRVYKMYDFPYLKVSQIPHNII